MLAVQTLADIFIENKQISISFELRKKFYSSILDRLMHAPVNLYHDVTPSNRVIKYLQEDVGTMDWYMFMLISNFVANKIKMVIILG